MKQNVTVREVNDMSNPYPHLCPYKSAVEGGLPCQCEPVTSENTRSSDRENLIRIIAKWDKTDFEAELVSEVEALIIQSNKDLLERVRSEVIVIANESENSASGERIIARQRSALQKIEDSL